MGTHVREIGQTMVSPGVSLSVALHQDYGEPARVWLGYRDDRHTEVVQLHPEAARELGGELRDAHLANER